MGTGINTQPLEMIAVGPVVLGVVVTVMKMRLTNIGAELLCLTMRSVAKREVE